MMLSIILINFGYSLIYEGGLYLLVNVISKDSEVKWLNYKSAGIGNRLGWSLIIAWFWGFLITSYIFNPIKALDVQNEGVLLLLQMKLSSTLH